jgi:hypothetical protein
MLDVRFFTIPRFGAGALGVTFAFFAMFSMFFLIAQFLQSVLGYSPLKAGICTLPFAATMIVMSPRGAALALKHDPKRVVSVGLFIMPFGMLILSLVDATSSYLVVALGLVVLAAGSGLALPTLSTGIVLSLPMNKAGVGSAVNDTTREVGGAVGIAVIGSILSAQYRSGIDPLLKALPPEASAVADAARDGVGALGGLVDAAPGVPELQGRLPQLESLLDAAKSSFVDGMQAGLRVGAVVVLLVAVIVSRWYPAGQLRPVGMPEH